MTTQKKYLIPRLSISLSLWLLIMTLFLIWHDGFGVALDNSEKEALAPLMILAPSDYVGLMDISRSQEWFVQFPEALDLDVENWRKARYHVYVIRPARLAKMGFQAGKPLLRVRGSLDLIDLSNETALFTPLGFDLFPQSMGTHARHRLMIVDLKTIVMTLLGLSMLIAYGMFTRRLRRIKASELSQQVED